VSARVFAQSQAAGAGFDECVDDRFNAAMAASKTILLKQTADCRR